MGRDPRQIPLSGRRCSTRLSIHEQERATSRAASARLGTSRLRLVMAPAMISAEAEGHRSVRSWTARDCPSTTEIVDLGEQSEIVASSSAAFKSFHLGVQVQLRELEHQQIDEKSLGLWSVLMQAIQGVSERTDRDLLQFVANALRTCYFDDDEPCCAKLKQSELFRKTLEHDAQVIKTELLNQVRELNYLRTEMQILQSANDRLTTELQTLQRKDRVLERHTNLMSEYLKSSRKECDAINEANQSLVMKMELADLANKQQIAALESNLSASEAKFLSVQQELALDRKISAEKDRQIEALEKDHARLMTQLEILQCAIESMSKSASLAIEDGRSDQMHLRNILEDAESIRKHGPIKGLGLTPDVPVFLRYDGWIPYKPITKGKVEAMCKRIWALKTTADSMKPMSSRTRLDEFFMQYMIRKIPNEKKRFEYIYNFVEELKNSVYDIDCDIFYRVLYQELSEEAFFDQSKMVAELKLLFNLWDRNSAGEEDGLIPVEVFKRGIRRFFPSKTTERLEELIQAALDHSMTDGNVDISKILLESEDGAQSPFMEMARGQVITEMLEFRAQIESAFMKIATLENGKLKMIPCQDVRRVLEQVATGFSSKEIDDLMRRGLQQDVFLPSDPVDVKLFVSNISTTGLLAPKGLYVFGAPVENIAAFMKQLKHNSPAALPRHEGEPELNA